MKFFALALFSALFLDLSTANEALAQGNPGYWNGNETEPFAGGVIREAYCDVIGYVEGEFGGLLMVIAGILAFGAAAFGDFKHGVTMIVTAIGAYTVSALVSLYFGQLCGGAAATNRAVNANRPANLEAALAIGAGRDVDFTNGDFQQFGQEENIDDPFN